MCACLNDFLKIDFQNEILKPKGQHLFKGLGEVNLLVLLIFATILLEFSTLNFAKYKQALIIQRRWKQFPTIAVRCQVISPDTQGLESPFLAIHSHRLAGGRVTR